MRKTIFVFLFLLLFEAGAYAGDLTCYGYTSTTDHFSCNISPANSGNCVWWAVYKRPDIAEKISGSGWDGGQWYDKLRDIGFFVGSVPKVGAIVEFSKPGHEAYVESVLDDGAFTVSEMDATGSFGSGGVYNATYSPNSDGTYHRNSGSQKWTLNGFIYSFNSGPSIRLCAQISANRKVCWDTKNSVDKRCESGSDCIIYDNATKWQFRILLFI
ncbi:MAG: CHAP domain-containing protein [Candidatus Moraniibacteriota bacterium]|nr:MAG: CHAP domain-containing protein [Candidatus Moranbacteria bacterium]